jgi:antirestriction protein ArdC
LVGGDGPVQLSACGRAATQEVRADHAQYLAHWLKLLKEDDRAIFTAAAKASEAVNYLKGLQAPAPEPPNGPRRTHGPGGARLG